MKTRNLFTLAMAALLLVANFAGRAQTGSIEFNTTNGTMDLGNHYGFDLDSVFTVEAWVKTSSNVDIHQVISKVDEHMHGWGFQFDLGTNQLSGYVINDYTVENMLFYTASATINDGQWHHLAMSYNGGGRQFQLFVDGTEVPGASHGTITGSITNSGNALTGSLEPQGTRGILWDGKIDDLRIWSGLRTGSQIAANRNCPLQGNEPGLDGYWNLEEGTGTSVSDKSVAALTGTLTGGATWSTDQPIHCATGVTNTPQLNGKTSVVPNPAYDYAMLNCSNELKDGRLIIVNHAGMTVRTVEHIQGGSIRLDRNDLPAGLYVIHVTDGGNSFTEKLILLEK